MPIIVHELLVDELTEPRPPQPTPQGDANTARALAELTREKAVAAHRALRSRAH